MQVLMMKRVITICNANVPPLCLLTAVAPRIPPSLSQMDLGFEPEEYPRGMLSLFTGRNKEFLLEGRRYYRLLGRASVRSVFTAIQS